jgi:tetratricopeptide (TPR) repeat protein
MALGNWESAIEALETALDELELLQQPGEVAAVCRSAAYLLAWTGRFQEALELAGRGLSVVGKEATEDRCALLSFSGVMIAAAGGYDLSKQMTDEALAMARTLGDPALLGHVLGEASIQDYWFQQPDVSARMGLEAIETLRREHAQFELSNLLGFTELGLIFGGRWEAALALHPEALELSRKVGHFGAEMCDIRTMFLISMPQGDFDEAERLAKEDMRVCRAGGLPWYRDSYIFQASCLFVRGDWEGAAELCREGDTYDIPYGAALVPRASLAMCLSYLDRRDEALALIDSLAGDFPTPGQPSHLGYWQIAMFAAEALMSLRELERLAALYPVLRAACEETTGRVRWFDVKLLDCLAGAAAAIAGERERSELHFARARKLAGSWGPRLVADCDYLEGWAALQRGEIGDQAEAKRLLTAAVEGHRKLGMPRHVEMIEGLLASV